MAEVCRCESLQVQCMLALLPECALHGQHGARAGVVTAAEALAGHAGKAWEGAGPVPQRETCMRDRREPSLSALAGRRFRDVCEEESLPCSCLPWSPRRRPCSGPLAPRCRWQPAGCTAGSPVAAPLPRRSPACTGQVTRAAAILKGGDGGGQRRQPRTTAAPTPTCGAPQALNQLHSASSLHRSAHSSGLADCTSPKRAPPSTTRGASTAADPAPTSPEV